MIRDFSNRDLYNYKYIPLIKNTKRYNILMGGGASGKSAFVAQREVIKSYSKEQKILCVRKVKDTLKESCYAELVSWIEKWGITGDFDITKSPMGIKNKLTGSSFIFRGMDDSEKIKSVSGLTRIWIEEANELSRQDFDQLDIRLRGKGKLQVTATYNPVNEEHFLNTDFYSVGNTEEAEVLHTTYLDNRFVSEQYKKTMERLKETNPTYYKIYALGEFAQLDDLVFPDYEVLTDIPEEAKYDCHGMDFGYRDPTAVVGVYEYNGGILLDEEYYQSEIITSEIVRALKEIEAGDVFADSAEPDRIEEIYQAGVNIYPARKGKGSIIFGIDKLKERKIYITARSKNLLREIRTYQWKKDKNGNVVKDSDGRPVPQYGGAHTLDASRYGVVKDSSSVEFETLIIEV